jgi:hypothetical protein
LRAEVDERAWHKADEEIRRERQIEGARRCSPQQDDRLRQVVHESGDSHVGLVTEITEGLYLQLVNDELARTDEPCQPCFKISYHIGIFRIPKYMTKNHRYNIFEIARIWACMRCWIALNQKALCALPRRCSDSEMNSWVVVVCVPHRPHAVTRIGSRCGGDFRTAGCKRSSAASLIDNALKSA